MGVMSCSKIGCDSILCDTYVESVGYICCYCQEEFKNYVEENKLNITNKTQITQALSKFMGIEKDGMTIKR